MKMTILNAFHDKHKFSLIYKVGQVAEFEDERAQDLIERGLATPVDSKEKEVAEETEHVASEEKEEPTHNTAEEPSKTVETVEEPKRRGRKPKGE